MIPPEIAARLAQMEKRLAQLEAAQGLILLRGLTDDEAMVQEIASRVGIGVRALQGRGRDRETATKRRLVAVALRREAGWTEARVSAVLHMSERHVRKMVRMTG